MSPSDHRSNKLSYFFFSSKYSLTNFVREETLNIKRMKYLFKDTFVKFLYSDAESSKLISLNIFYCSL